MPRATYEGSLVTRREEIPHKCDRIGGSQVGSNDIHNVTKSRNFNSCKDGQHGGSVLLMTGETKIRE